MVSDSIDWTPIMIKTILDEALVLAYEDGRDRLTYKDWLAAADARTLGLRQPIRRMHDDDRRAIAYHEAGHAVAAYYLQTGEPHPQGDDHPTRRRPGCRPAAATRGALHAPRPPDRDPHHDVPRVARGRGGDPRRR